MKQRLLLEYAPNSETYRWASFMGDGSIALPAKVGDWTAFLAAYKILAAADVVLVIDSPEVACKNVAFSASEKRHILQTVRFELEEELISDIDELHFAYAKPGDRSLQLLMVDKHLLTRWLAPFQEHNIKVVAAIPLGLALGSADELDPNPNLAGQWLVNVGADTLVIKHENGFFTTSLGSARLACDLAVKEQDALPSSICVYSESSQQAEQALVELPQALLPLVDEHNIPWFAKSNWKQLQASTINLLQGDFSLQIAWAKIWQYWKIPTVLFVLGLSVFTLSAFLDRQRLQSSNDQLREQLVAVYLQAFPNSQVSDPERQMQAKLKALQGGGVSSRFVQLFYKTVKTLAGFNGVNVLTINFDQRNNELRADIVAKKFNDIEKLRIALNNTGIVADLVSSNSVDGGERARMKFKEK